MNSTNWVKLDDQNAEQADLEQIMSLEGGGDFHSAYIMLWQRKSL